MGKKGHVRKKQKTLFNTNVAQAFLILQVPAVAHAITLAKADVLLLAAVGVTSFIFFITGLGLHKKEKLSPIVLKLLVAPYILSMFITVVVLLKFSVILLAIIPVIGVFVAILSAISIGLIANGSMLTFLWIVGSIPALAALFFIHKKR